MQAHRHIKWRLVLKLLMRTFSWLPWIPGTLKLDSILSLFMCAFNLILSYPFDVRADCGEYKFVGMKCLTTCTADDKVSVETVLQTFPNFLHYVQVQVF